MSNRDLGPIGSASIIVFIISSPVTSLSFFLNFLLFPNLVSNLSTEYESIGTTFPPASTIFYFRYYFIYCTKRTCQCKSIFNPFNNIFIPPVHLLCYLLYLSKYQLLLKVLLYLAMKEPIWFMPYSFAFFKIYPPGLEAKSIIRQSFLILFNISPPNIR